MTYIKLFVDYLDAIEPLGDAERGRLFTALLQYARTGEAPQLNGNERFLFPMMRAQIDRDEAAMDDLSAIRSAAGKKGAEAKLSRSKQNKQMPDLHSKTSKGKDKDKDKDEKETSPDGDVKKDPAVAAVMTAYMDRINPNVSEQLVAEMIGFLQVMGQECCLRAIQIAQDERKTQWSYVRGILRSKQSQGVRCLADWDAIEEQREKKKQGGDDGYEYL